MKSIKALFTVIRWVRRFFFAILFVLSLAFTFASHTVSAVSDIASSIISSVSGVTTLIAQERENRRIAQQQAGSLQDEVAGLRRSNGQLEADVEAGRLRATALEDDVVGLRASNAQLSDDLLQERRVSLEATERLALAEADLSDVRARNLSLGDELLEREAINGQLVRRNQALEAASTPINFRGRALLPAEATDEVLETIQARTRRVATSNVSSMAGEGIPFYGVAVIVLSTSYELFSACETMNDLYELRVALNPDSAIPDDRDEVCGLQVPTREELWTGIVNSPSNAWEAVQSLYADVPGYIDNLPEPDFGGAWGRFTAWAGSWISEE